MKLFWTALKGTVDRKQGTFGRDGPSTSIVNPLSTYVVKPLRKILHIKCDL